VKHILIFLSLWFVLLVACAPTPVPTVPPPTATPVPPTATPIPPTATLVPPTATPVPPTATPVPPTATRPPATATPTQVAAASPVPTFAPNAVCASTGSLEDLIACITSKMPRRETQGFIVPDANAQADWKQVAAQMLAGKCDDITLPTSIKNIYTVGTFKDSGKNYCALFEILDENKNGFIDRGWGTFIVNNAATRELSIQAPHPLFDLATEAQAISVFKGVNARTYLLAGAHREADKERSVCEPATGDGIADPAHNTTMMFQSTVETLTDYYKSNGKDWNLIQFHGMGTTSCVGVDAFLSYGMTVAPKPGEKILDLRASIVKRQPKWVVNVYGENPPCDLYATTNVQGRLLNGVSADQVCTMPATNYTGKFIHIEQKTNSRAAIADWIAAILDTWK
jgi:hypothetical protein